MHARDRPHSRKSLPAIHRGQLSEPRPVHPMLARWPLRKRCASSPRPLLRADTLSRAPLLRRATAAARLLAPERVHLPDLQRRRRSFVARRTGRSFDCNTLAPLRGKLRGNRDLQGSESILTRTNRHARAIKTGDAVGYHFRHRLTHPAGPCLRGTQTTIAGVMRTVRDVVQLDRMTGID